VRAIAAAGHGIGNHSDRHSFRSPLFGTARLAADLSRAQEAIVAAGVPAPRWFRPPVGLFGPRVEPAARRVGLLLCAWTLRSNDGSRVGYGAPRVLSRLRARLRDGDVVVLHDAPTRPGRAPIAPAILPELAIILEQRGLRSVTLDELFGEAVSSPHAKTLCGARPAGAGQPVRER
jgi:peptidoglycan/xylan/chitin deacetylase (PgdA/CDA1 family)